MRSIYRLKVRLTLTQFNLTYGESNLVLGSETFNSVSDNNQVLGDMMQKLDELSSMNV